MPPSGSSSSAPSVSARSSNASANSFEYADETSSLDSQRLSVQSVDSNQVCLLNIFSVSTRNDVYLCSCRQISAPSLQNRLDEVEDS